MNATLAPGASLRRVAEIVRHRVLFGTGAWGGDVLVSIGEGDIASLLQRHRCEVEPLLQRLHPHLEEGDRHELRVIVKDIQARIARFEQFKKS